MAVYAPPRPCAHARWVEAGPCFQDGWWILWMLSCRQCGLDYDTRVVRQQAGGAS